MEIKKLRLTDLEINRGQVPGLPSNPRQWSRGDLDKLIQSIKDTPELLEARGPIVWPYEGKYIILGGNMRFSALREIGVPDVKCIVMPEDMPIAKLREIVVLDNGQFGAWDYDMLANEWDDLPLCEMGVPAWETELEDLEQPTNLDDNDAKEKPFVAKITFPDAAKMSLFVLDYKNIIEEKYGCTISQSGGLL